MGKVNVYLPDDLEQQVREAGISISAVCQVALRDVLETFAAVDGVDGNAPPRRTRMTERLTSILAEVRAEATERGRPADAHDLLGAVIRHGENLGAHALRNLGVELPRPQPRPRSKRAKGSPLAPDARDLVKAAVAVALDMRHNYVGAEHVVIAAAGEASPLRDLFAALGIDARAVRTEVERLLVNPWRAPGPPRGSAPELVAHFEAELQRLAAEFQDLKGRLGRD